MDNNYNGFTPEGGNNNMQGNQQPAYANNNAYQQPVYDNNAYQQQYAAPTPAANDFANQIAQGNTAVGADGTVAVAKKKSKLPLAIGGAVLGVAGVGALLFAFVAPVKNWVKITFMKPEKYFASVEEQAFSEYSATLSETYGGMVNTINGEGTTVSYGVELTVGDKFMEILQEEAAANGEEIPEFTFESLGIDMSAASDSEKGGINAGITLNGESVISANAVYDMAEQMFYLQVPELSQAYLTASIGEYIEEYSAEMGIDAAEFDTEALISEEDMKRIIEDYANIVYSSIETVEIAKNEEIDVAGKDFSFNIMEFELNEEELLEIVLEVLETAADDDAIADMVNGLGYEYDDVIDSAIESVETALDDTNDENYIVGRIYVDARGEIMGREYTVYSDDEETGIFYYIIGADGDDLCVEAVMEADGEEVMNVEVSRIGEELEGSAVADGEEILTIEGTYESEAYSGTVTLITPEDEEYGIEGEEVEIGFENLKTTGENDEYLTGTIFIEVPEDDEDAAELIEYGVERIELVFESDGKVQDVSFVIGELLSITVSAGVQEGADIDIPSDGDMYDMETELEAYLETVDYTPAVQKVLELLGLDDEYTAEEIVTQLEEAMTASGDDYYDDWEEDWDDEDWDDDDWDDDDWTDEGEETWDYIYLDFHETVEVNAFGETLSWPLKAETFCAYFGLDPDMMVDANDYDYVYTDTDTELDYYNPFDEAVRLGDCYIDYIKVDAEDEDFLITFNGLGIGSSIDAINAAYGTDFTVTNGEVEIEDSNYWDVVVFELEDGVVTEIYYSGDEDYTYDTVINGSSDEDDDDSQSEEDDDDQSYEDDYDYEYVSLSNNAVISVLGYEGTWPCKAAVFCEYFGLDPDMMVEPYGYDYIYNDFGSEIDYYNPFGDEIRLGDCYIDYIYVNPDDTGFAITMNGVGIGDTLEDINTAFETEFAVTNGSVKVEDSYYWDSVTYYLEDGVITTMYITGDVDAILDNLSSSSDVEEEPAVEDSFGTGTVIQ